MKRVLILSCGTNSGYHVSKIISSKYKDEFFLIGTDINEQHLVASILYLNKFYKILPSSNPSFYNEVLDIIAKEKVDILIPIYDQEQKIFNKDNKDLIKLGVKTLAPKESVFDVYGNKIKLFEFLKQKKLPVPKTYTIDEINDNKSYFIKPIDGAGSIGSSLLAGKEVRKINDIKKYIIQEVCSNPEITLECFKYNERISSVARERIQAKSGICTKTCICKNNELEEIAKKFSQVIDVPYVFNLQFMKNKDEKFVITDINLRFAGGMALSYKAGWDEASALAEVILGKSEEDIFKNLNLNYEKQWIVRVYDEIITKQV